MEESTFLWYGTRIGNDTKSVLLKLVVVKEAKWLMLDDALVKLKAFLFDHLLTAWVRHASPAKSLRPDTDTLAHVGKAAVLQDQRQGLLLGVRRVQVSPGGIWYGRPAGSLRRTGINNDN